MTCEVMNVDKEQGKQERGNRVLFYSTYILCVIITYSITFFSTIN